MALVGNLSQVVYQSGRGWRPCSWPAEIPRRGPGALITPTGLSAVPGLPVRWDVGAAVFAAVRPGLRAILAFWVVVATMPASMASCREGCRSIDRRRVPSVISYRCWPRGGRFFICFASTQMRVSPRPGPKVVRGWFLATRVAAPRFARARYSSVLIVKERS